MQDARNACCDEASALTMGDGNNDSPALRELAMALGNPCLEPLENESLADALIREAVRRIKQMPRVPWQQTRTIATLPGTRLTPQVLLARTLEKAAAGKIRSVYVGIEWADSQEYVGEWSSQPVNSFAMHAAVAQRCFTTTAFNINENDTACGGDEQA